MILPKGKYISLSDNNFYKKGMHVERYYSSG
jgi:hypothetical protein